MCLETISFAVTVADHSILMGLHAGMIFFQMYPVGSQDLGPLSFDLSDAPGNLYSRKS